MNNHNTEKRLKEKVKGVLYYLSEIRDSFFMFMRIGVIIFVLAGLIYANSVLENLNDKLTADLNHHAIEEDLGITTEEAKEYTVYIDGNKASKDFDAFGINQNHYYIRVDTQKKKIYLNKKNALEQIFEY